MQNINIVNETKSHSRGFLSGISATLEIQGGDPRLQPSGMTKRSGHGFTLIELLVVVLIIGILAAVALPQYNKAVKKARGTEALAAIDALDKAIQSYYLEHGSYEGINQETLNIELPELQHFKYAVGTDVHNYGDGNFQPLPNFFRHEQNNNNNLTINVLNSEVAVKNTWENGGIVQRRCFVKVTSDDSCSDYFNCAAPPRVSTGGTANVHTGGDCTL